MNSSIFRYSILFVILLTFGSWGKKAHRKINYFQKFKQFSNFQKEFSGRYFKVQSPF